MAQYQFNPRKTFSNDLRLLSQIDPSIIDETRAAINILLDGDRLPKEYKDHGLKRKYAGYREFHLRDTPEKEQPTELNDVVVIYKIKEQDLVLVAVRIGSHNKLLRNN
ncbi:type II toxin-antitoxin system YafQ family toxin [Limosilactobacillus sp.]|jgi:mRNA interferase YafQ|uniref:type II toxin-antitoxin system YafQ family toxin n=1 Tax=Limosilactobacillus sp. TaxID=2773925 RepID=UPI0025C651DF|nr:type II toxin-antitoxin system YafQ family toxin [Limosilactobacillus sp.]MCH3922826.1 type II toxin-antitoxin system YafQ family toxin [Limosilactobacillus sp.]MCH3927509.1 type II toxin-antitoxin system YafQ family toxin [Limosilactobacillus sp.]